jgi:hypothetical protein
MSLIELVIPSLFIRMRNLFRERLMLRLCVATVRARVQLTFVGILFFAVVCGDSSHGSAATVVVVPFHAAR